MMFENQNVPLFTQAHSNLHFCYYNFVKNMSAVVFFALYLRCFWHHVFPEAEGQEQGCSEILFFPFPSQGCILTRSLITIKKGQLFSGHRYPWNCVQIHFLENSNHLCLSPEANASAVGRHSGPGPFGRYLMALAGVIPPYVTCFQTITPVIFKVKRLTDAFEDVDLDHLG